MFSAEAQPLNYLAHFSVVLTESSGLQVLGASHVSVVKIGVLVLAAATAWFDCATALFVKGLFN